MIHRRSSAAARVRPSDGSACFDALPAACLLVALRVIFRGNAVFRSFSGEADMSDL